MTLPESSDAERRLALIGGQKPYAVILSCSDSRVPPEIIFDSGLGEIFVVRVAGNIPDPIVLGSIEYAAEHLDTPLIMVLGHERCGAVSATVSAGGKAEGNIGAIVEVLAPAVEQARREVGDKGKSAVVEAAADINVRRVCDCLATRSEVLGGLVAAGKIKIVGARYDFEDGKVTLLDK